LYEHTLTSNAVYERTPPLVGESYDRTPLTDVVYTQIVAAWSDEDELHASRASEGGSYERTLIGVLCTSIRRPLGGEPYDRTTPTQVVYTHTRPRTVMYGHTLTCGTGVYQSQPGSSGMKRKCKSVRYRGGDSMGIHSRDEARRTPVRSPGEHYGYSLTQELVYRQTPATKHPKGRPYERTLHPKLAYPDIDHLRAYKDS
jgi:hypothetical protein